MAWPYDTAQWKRLRLRQLHRHPLCETCLQTGIIKAANHVDHRRAISHGGDPFPDDSGLSSLCHSCHSHKTSRSPEAGAVKTNRPRKGCDVNGWPLDPDHPWKRDE